MVSNQRMCVKWGEIYLFNKPPFYRKYQLFWIVRIEVAIRPVIRIYIWSKKIHVTPAFLCTCLSLVMVRVTGTQCSVQGNCTTKWFVHFESFPVDMLDDWALKCVPWLFHKSTCDSGSWFSCNLQNDMWLNWLFPDNILIRRDSGLLSLLLFLLWECKIKTDTDAMGMQTPFQITDFIWLPVYVESWLPARHKCKGTIVISVMFDTTGRAIFLRNVHLVSKKYN